MTIAIPPDAIIRITETADKLCEVMRGCVNPNEAIDAALVAIIQVNSEAVPTIEWAELERRVRRYFELGPYRGTDGA